MEIWYLINNQNERIEICDTSLHFVPLSSETEAAYR